MYNIAVLGDRDSVMGFSVLGLDVFPVETEEEARVVLHKLTKGNFGIIYITEQLAHALEAEMKRYKDALTPALVLIPGKEGSLGIGMQNVRRAVERATGSDIF